MLANPLCCSQGASAPGFPTNSFKNVPEMLLGLARIVQQIKGSSSELLGSFPGSVTGCAQLPPGKTILFFFSFQSCFFSLLWGRSRGIFGKGQDVKLLRGILLVIQLTTSSSLIQRFPQSSCACRCPWSSQPSPLSCVQLGAVNPGQTLFWGSHLSSWSWFSWC